MSLSFLFWLLMIIWLIFGIWAAAPQPQARPPWLTTWSPWGGTLLLFILLFLLGWRVFGFVITG